MSKKKVYKTVQVPKVVYETQVIAFQVRRRAAAARHTAAQRSCRGGAKRHPRSTPRHALSRTRPSLPPSHPPTLLLIFHSFPFPPSQVPRIRQVQRLVEVEHEEYEMVRLTPPHPSEHYKSVANRCTPLKTAANRGDDASCAVRHEESERGGVACPPAAPRSITEAFQAPKAVLQ
jgi:hypothetical protein